MKKQQMGTNLAAIFGLVGALFPLATAAYAACPALTNGVVALPRFDPANNATIFTQATTTATAVTEGAIAYDAMADVLYVCNGTSWNTAGSGPFERSGTLVRPSSAATISTDDFVFGSSTIDDDGSSGSDDDVRMLFIKAKGAFRAGSGADFDAIDDNAFDAFDTINVGLFSTGMGYYPKAYGDYSTASGYAAEASGFASSALGGGIAKKQYASAFGNGYADGEFSGAVGSGFAGGHFSFAAGLSAFAESYAETSFGRYSLVGGTLGSWVATDTLFEIGNGVSTAARANALTLLKNGNMIVGNGTPQSRLHVPDGGYLQAEDHNAGAPPAGDCDNDAERGRISLDTSNNRLYVCMGAARGWDYSALTD